MSLNSTYNDIKNLKIQGAIAVAREGVGAVFNYSRNISSKTKNPKEAVLFLKKAAKKIISARSTEPALRNALSYFFYNLNSSSMKTLLIHTDLKYNTIMNHFDAAEKKIIEYGVRKIKNGFVVYTHCHSSTVCNILKEAKRRKIRFEVHNTETRPLYQGRKTAKELAKVGIKVTHYIDSAAKHAIKKADIVLLGTDAISTTKIYNKIGSETIAMLADYMDVPVYICSDSWKFDPLTIFGFDEVIEKRLSKEVWPNSPKNINIYNYAFDKISPKFITGIISELGVFGHSSFIEEVNKKIGKITKSISF